MSASVFPQAEHKYYLADHNLSEDCCNTNLFLLPTIHCINNILCIYVH